MELGRCFNAALSASSYLPIVCTDDQLGCTYLLVVFVAVESRNVHACIEHFLDHFNVVTGGSQCAHDLGLSEFDSHWLENILEVDSVSAEVVRPQVVDLGAVVLVN